MINNIKILCKREVNILTKKRIFVFAYAIIGLLFSIFVLIAINRIINMANAEGIFNYENVTFLHERLIDALYVLTIFSSIFFLSSAINNDKNNFILDNILSSDVSMLEIIISKLIIGYFSTIIIGIFVIPIIMLSLFYGGTSITKFLLYIILMFFIVLLSGSLSLLFSFIFKDNIKSILSSIIVGIVFSIFYILFRKVIISKGLFYMAAIIINILISIIILLITSRLRYDNK